MLLGGAITTVSIARTGVLTTTRCARWQPGSGS
jgi:hypothetical protein